MRETNKELTDRNVKQRLPFTLTKGAIVNFNLYSYTADVSTSESAYGNLSQVYVSRDIDKELLVAGNKCVLITFDVASSTGWIIVAVYSGTPTLGHWEDLRIEPTVRGAGARNPSFEKYFDNAAGTSIGVFLYSFDDVAAASEKEVFFTMQMPHSWRQGTPIHLHCHWVGTSNDTTATPRWGLEYAFKDIGQTFGDTTTIYATGNIMDNGLVDADITAGRHYLTEFEAINPDSTCDNVSAILIGRVFRNSSAAADTYNVAGNKCGLLYIDAHYLVEDMGSINEYYK